MPLKSKKKPAKPVLRSVKSVSKPKLKAKAPPKGLNIFRKILAERAKLKEEPKLYRSDHRGHPPQQQRHEQFAKFAGPRRRAA